MSFNTLRTRLPFAIALALSAVAIVVATASATAPGSNGRIAFRRYFDHQQDWGAVFTIAANGKGTRQITHPARGSRRRAARLGTRRQPDRVRAR